MKQTPAPLPEKKFTKASEALQAARNLIRDTKRWVKGSLAVRTVYGYATRKDCSTKAKNAEAFCALGAVKRINGPAERAATAFLREAALYTLHQKNTHLKQTRPSNDHIFSVNDAKGHATVLKMFRRAIYQAKKAEN